MSGQTGVNDSSEQSLLNTSRDDENGQVPALLSTRASAAPGPYAKAGPYTQSGPYQPAQEPGAGGSLDNILNSEDPTARKEQLIQPPSGQMMKYIGYGLIAVGAIFNLFGVLPIFKLIITFGQSQIDASGFVLAGIGALLDAAGIFILQGIIIINPGDAVLMMDSGEYKGTIKKNGEVWAVPTYEKIKVSTKQCCLNGKEIKVNDKTGNPIMIGITAVYKVDDTYKALFDVNSYETFVQVQSEAALRSLASQYSYDICNEGDNELLTLRGGKDEPTKVLVKELQERLDRAGIKILEARISHLSYAPEIAETMLKRQKAVSLIAAQKTIVDGAIGVVEMAIENLEKTGKVELSAAQKATVVSDLLTQLCKDHK